MRLRQLYILIVLVFAGLAVQVILASPASAYLANGGVTSTNLLSGSSASSINNFYYNIFTLPGNSSVLVQFSTDNTNWYSAGRGLKRLNYINYTRRGEFKLIFFGLVPETPFITNST